MKTGQREMIPTLSLNLHFRFLLDCFELAY